MLLAWKSTDWAARNYVFTISNAEFVPNATLDIAFANGSKEMIEINETTTLEAATNWNESFVVWSSSDESIATVENGVVTGVKGGEVTITATVGELSVSKTVYVVGEGLYSNQIGVHAYGWNQTSNASYFNMASENGEMVATVKFAGSTTHYPSIVLRELHSKAYYERLIAEGYAKLTFNLAVGGENATNISDLYIFGNQLTNYAKNSNDEYVIILDLQYMVDNYAKVSGIGTSVEAKNAELNYMLLAWKSTDWTARNYVFTISNAKFMPNPTLEVSANKTEIAYGEEAKATATTNWTTSEIVWNTSDATIATVENGVVTVTGENWGDVTITATVAGISKAVTITVTTPTLSVDFAEGNTNVVTVDGTTTLNATTDWNAERVEWISSNDAIATVENGVVTGVNGGEVVITAMLNDLMVETTVYVVGNTLDTDNFAVIAGAWNQPGYVSTGKSENGELEISAQFKGDQWRWPAVVLRNLDSKAYYEALIANGYTKFTFNLTVGGENAANVSDLYVFGKLLSTFPYKDGVYTIIVDVQHLVDNYDTIGILGTSVEAVPSKYHSQMLISWKCTASNASTTRKYVFTISNVEYKYKEGDLYSNQIGIHAYGWNQSGNASYLSKAKGDNGEMIISAKFAGSTTHYPALVLREMFNKEYYEGLIAEGYAKLTFNLAVGGTNAENVSDLYIFGKNLTKFAKNADGEYAIVLDLQYMVDNYAKVSGLGTSVEAKNAELNYMFLAWKSTDWTARNYVFTISNTAFRKGILFSDDFGFRDGGVNKTYDGMTVDTGANGEIIIEATFNATENYGSFLMFNNMDTITYLGGLKGKYASFTFELTVEGGPVNDLHTFGTAKAISTCNKVEGKENTYVVEIRLDMQYFTETNTWIKTMTTFADPTVTQTGQIGSRSQMLLAWRTNGSTSFTANHEPRNYRFTIANFELRESLLYTY